MRQIHGSKEHKSPETQPDKYSQLRFDKGAEVTQCWTHRLLELGHLIKAEGDAEAQGGEGPGWTVRTGSLGEPG